MEGKDMTEHLRSQSFKSVDYVNWDTSGSQPIAVKVFLQNHWSLEFRKPENMEGLQIASWNVLRCRIPYDSFRRGKNNFHALETSPSPLGSLSEPKD